MAGKQNVQQQNSATRSEIAHCARRVVNRDPGLSWLPAILAARRIDPSRGILAVYSETAGQDGRRCAGTWLTTSREFWEFQVLIPAAANDPPVVERFEERSVSVFAHQQGIGKSFGALAIEVLDEVLDR